MELRCIHNLIKGDNMKNYITQNDYSGANVDILSEAGFNEDDSFVTFKQALKIKGVSGKTLKGLKACATLFFFKEEEDKATGEKVKVKKYFNVFDVKPILERVNQKAA